MSTRYTPSEGDWVCPDSRCANVNFAKRDRCNKCGKAKSTNQSVKKSGVEIGKRAADKSKGLFTADDWHCNACGNINWARRMTCNMCNTPKYNRQGSRTGYGGGFMERDEVVEYRERDESDDEFDEFGRKKKQYRGQKKVSGPILSKEESQDSVDSAADRARRRKASNMGDDEEDEDDDEDGDLSKYDLWGDDDVNDEVKEKDNRHRSSSVSSSASSSASDSTKSSRSSSSRSSASSASRGRDGRRSRSRSRSQSRSSSSHQHNHRRARNASSSSGDSRHRSRSPIHRRR